MSASPRKRSKAPASGANTDGALAHDERKEKVLHTRVPQSLDRQIKQRARSLGMSVSTVVRHVLLNTFGLVEDIVTDSANLALSIAGGDELASSEKPNRRGTATDGQADDGDVVGWQEAILNVNAVCDRCNAVLRRGAKAAMAIRERPGPRAVVCTKCIGRFVDRTRANARGTKRRRGPVR